MNAREALLAVADAIVETVRDMPNGAPGGPLYAAMMVHGMSLDTFEKLMAALVAAGRLEKRGQVYYPCKPRKDPTCVLCDAGEDHEH